MTTVNTHDTWENRIATASKIMGLEPAKVEEILNSPGYEISNSEYRMEMISDENVTPFGDLRKLFCEEYAKIPLPKLRMAMKYLRGPAESKKTDTIDPDLLDMQTRYCIRTKLEDLDIAQLLPYYKPAKISNIHTILRDRYESKYGAFIAFKPETTEIAIEETINYIADLESGYPSETHVGVDGEPVKLYKVGQVPNQMLDEDPLFVGSPLKRERSINNYLNWNGITHEVRTFFRILLQRGEINVNNRVETAQLIKKTIADLKEIFPKAYIEWSELKHRDELPKLHISINEPKVTGYSPYHTTNNPFNVGQNRKF